MASSAVAPALPSSTQASSSGPRQKQSTSNSRSRSKAQNDLDQPPTVTSSSSIASSIESNPADQHTNDRLLFLLANFVGNSTSVTLTNGQQFSGIFSAASLDPPEIRYVLKMTRQTCPPKDQKSNGNLDPPLVGFGPDHVMEFANADIAHLSAANVSLDKAQLKLTNGASSDFRTDTDISGNLAVRERELQPWQPSADVAPTMSLNGSANGQWDQFETNERLYGVKTDYDENFYTTAIDKSAPSYRSRAAAADRKAREIETSTNSNIHKADEENDLDEEERFSGVRRDPQALAPSSSNRYTAPARRAPTGQPTVPGAPVDPAIISSQLARPDSASAHSKGQQPKNTQDSTSAASKSKESSTAARADAPPATNASSTLNPLGTDKPKLDTASAAAAAPPRSPAKNATETVERDVLKSFKEFKANEKLKLQERQRTQVRRDKEVKINDLRRFAATFKLKSEVPPDMLGILAKDPKKQGEILEKSKTEAIADKDTKEQTSPPKPTVPVEPSAQRTGSVSKAEAGNVPANAPVEPASTRAGGGGGRGNQRAFNNSRNERFQQNGYMGAGRGNGPSAFSQNIQQRYGPRASMQPMMPMQDMRLPPTGPAAINTDLAMQRSGSVATPSSAASSRFNVQAMEFKPNPAASTFSPSAQSSTLASSLPTSRPVSKAHSPIKRSFFGEKRPRPTSERRSIADDFNPIKRMAKEAEDEGKTQDFVANGGIPQAYRTPLTWDVRPENSEKVYTDMIDKPAVNVAQALPAANGAMAHQHQLPFHLQQGAHMSPQQMHGQHHTPRFNQVPMQHGPRDHQFDDHRMQYSSSGSTGFPSSPRMHQGMMMQQSPMAGHAQPVYVQQPVYMGPNGQPMQFRPVQQGQMGFNQQGVPMVPTMVNQAGQYMQMPGQQMQMYSPGQGQPTPLHPAGPQTPNGYQSPRGPPMMMQQGSQQGHQPQVMYLAPSQQGQQPYYVQQPQHPQQMGHMRGGVPMQPQGSMGAGSHMPQHYPMQHRGPQQFAGNFPQQQQQHQMPPQQPVNHQQPTTMSQGHEEGK